MLDKKGNLICKEVRIENTNYCNARCIICPRDEMTRPKAIMGNEHFNYLLGQAVALGAEQVSIFGFGEPLLDKHIAYKVELASEYKLETHITTNAALLKPEIAFDLIHAGLNHIRFSIHGITPRTYSNVHRGLDWDRTIGNVDHFRRLNDELGHPCTVHISCIPQHGESVKEIKKALKHLSDYVEIWKPHNWGGKRKYRTDEAIRDCYRPFSGPVQVQADGGMIPCCFLTDGEVVLGNTYSHTMEDILRGDAYKAFQKHHRENDLAGLPCENCDQRAVPDESPLLYSNRDPNRELNKLSTSKIKLGGN